MNELIPIWMDPQIIDMTRLVLWFGNLSKRFNSWEEKRDWIKKARKLGWKGELK